MSVNEPTLPVSPNADLPEVKASPERESIEVAAGVLRDDDGRVLLSRRLPGKHLAGMWEFPGGKIHAGESDAEALAREFLEEVGVRIGPVRPLVAVVHDYREKTVRLKLYEIHSSTGEPHGAEGQELKWVQPAAMGALEMPAADRPLVKLLDLDGHYSISRAPSEFGSSAEFLDAWSACVEAGYRLIRLRPAPGERVEPEVIEAVDHLTRKAGARWIASGDLTQCFGWPADGIHLNTRQLVTLDRRPLPDDWLVIASCHDLEEIRIADAVGADLVTLSPVEFTSSHPAAAPLGWHDFERIVRYAPLPVLALGGVRPDDWSRARAAGAFGVAGIRAFGWG